MESVAIVKVKGDPFVGVEKGVELVGGAGVSLGAKVVIKPNVCNAKNPYGMVITDFSVIESAVSIVRRATSDITIVESDNISGPAERRVVESGLIEKIEEWGVEFIDLSKDEFQEHEVAGAKIRIPETIIEADYFMNLPKMKTCGPTLVTLSMKNLFGVLVRRKKKRLHKHLNEILPYLSKVVRQDLIIVDGIICMEGNGPEIGTPRRLDLVIVGKNPVEVDSVCTKIMGFDPEEVKHIVNASKMGVGQMDLEKIKILGEKLEGVSTSFDRPYSLRATLKSLKSIRKIYL